ncbi:hypothetical protein [Neobacillus sp. 204]|uniref:hypothetical protein n=1 Tax=Neobacillus sp. 204 TaxID=3383351 RepID=UPI003978B358
MRPSETNLSIDTNSYSLWLESLGLNIDFTTYFYYLLVELKVFIENTLLIGAEGTKTPAGVRVRGDPAEAKRRGGYPARPRKAKCLERQSTDLFKVYLPIYIIIN